jgi:hypothetical protein
MIIVIGLQSLDIKIALLETKKDKIEIKRELE